MGPGRVYRVGGRRCHGVLVKETDKAKKRGCYNFVNYIYFFVRRIRSLF